MRARWISVLLLALAAATGVAAAQPPAAGQPFDACALLTAEELQAVQGEALQGTKASQRQAAGYLFAQCYFAAARSELSVSLEVTLADRGHASPASPAERWREIFHREDKEGGNGEEGEESDPPQPVPGLGDEAFWVGDARVGALYVLAGDRFLRLSPGGPDAPEAKLEKARQLAARALERL